MGFYHQKLALFTLSVSIVASQSACLGLSARSGKISLYVQYPLEVRLIGVIPACSLAHGVTIKATAVTPAKQLITELMLIRYVTLEGVTEPHL